MLELSAHLGTFESVLDDMKQRGRTAIYSSVVEAARMLQPLAAASPETDLRVLVLSDGQSNAGVPPRAALKAAREIGAVVDAIIVGDSPDANLLRIVAATGGDCFQIRTLSDGFELMEAETVVSLAARRAGAARPQRPGVPTEAELDELFATAAPAAVKSSHYGVPATGSSTAKAVKVVSAKQAQANLKGKGGAVMKRVAKELCDSSGPSDGCHLFPDPDDARLMRALVEGPVGSPFEGGTFVLNIALPDDYPFKPPRVTFETPVFHCNVNDAGAICLDILKDNWSPALTVPKVLQSVRALLGDPNSDDAMRQWIAELTIAHARHGDADTRYVDGARELVAKHAAKSVDEWRREWGVQD